MFLQAASGRARRSVPVLLVCASLTAGCASSSPPGAAPAHAATAAVSVDPALEALSGRWDFTVDLGQRTTPGEFWLFVRGAEMTGTLTPSGTNTLPVRVLTLHAREVAMTVDTPDGPVTFAGRLDAGGRAMRGSVTYHGGQRFPLEARKRAAEAGGAP